MEQPSVVEYFVIFSTGLQDTVGYSIRQDWIQKMYDHDRAVYLTVCLISASPEIPWWVQKI